MILIVKYFGAIAEVTQKGEEQFHLDNETNSLLTVKAKLEERYPGIKNIPYAFALNEAMVREDATINRNDVLALLPPFAGG